MPNRVELADEVGAAITDSNPLPISGTVTSSSTTGNVAHDSPDSGNPVKIGGKAADSAPTAVTGSDRVDGWFGTRGQQVVTIASISGGLTAVNVLSSATLATTNNGMTAQAVVYGFDGTNCVKIPGNGSGLYVQSGASQYETVAASQTDQMIGPTGAAGDLLERLIIIPATTSPGEVSIEDGSTNIIVFAGGASSVNELRPIEIYLGIRSTTGGWEVTTGTNVSAIAVGKFT